MSQIRIWEAYNEQLDNLGLFCTLTEYFTTRDDCEKHIAANELVGYIPMPRWVPLSLFKPSNHTPHCQEYWERGLECRCIPEGVKQDILNGANPEDVM